MLDKKLQHRKMSIPGHDICDRLKAIRREIALRNGIELDIPQCNSAEPCTGTCPQCENEVQTLEKTLQRHPNPDIIGVGVTLCNEFDPKGLPFVAKNYLAEYRYTHGHKIEKIVNLRETIIQMETELATLRQQKLTALKAHQIEIGIQNLNELIMKLKE